MSAKLVPRYTYARLPPSGAQFGWLNVPPVASWCGPLASSIHRSPSLTNRIRPASAAGAWAAAGPARSVQSNAIAATPGNTVRGIRPATDSERERSADRHQDPEYRQHDRELKKR